MKPYTITITEIHTRTFNGLRVQAVIKPCAKRGIRVRRQKTLRLKTIAPAFTRQEMALSIEREFDRWAEKKLATQTPLMPKEIL